MRKLLLSIFIGIILLSQTCYSQAPNYAFQSATGTYTALSGGTPVTLTYNGAGNNDDGITIPANAVPIGFPFAYNGTIYSAIKPCANGWASFSTTALTNNTDTWTNNLAGGPAANQRPLIAPLWDDMDMTSGTVTYQLSGASPNRVLTIEWAGCKWDYNGVSAAMSYQVKLYETTNIIEFVYKQESGPVAANSGGATIGISGTATNSFLSLDGSGTSPMASASVEKTDIVTKPATGQIYRWIPYCSGSATNTTGEKISNFTYSSINNNSSSTAGYENFSSLLATINLFPNSTLPFSVNVSSFTTTDQVVVYADLNHNGDFSDPGETLFTSSTPLSTGTVSGTLTIPVLSSTVLQGRTRLRIRLHDTGNGPNATSCGSSTTGQVEDYSIDIEPCTAAAITGQPSNISICNNGSGSISVSATGSGLTYQWQMSTDGGVNYSNVTNSGVYSGATTATLNITGAIASMNGTLYKVIINGTCTPPNVASSPGMLTINTPGVITANPLNSTVCEKSNASFSVTATGSSPSYQWMVSTDGGITYTNIANTNSATLSLPLVKNDMSLNRYKVIATVASCGSVTSSGAILKVNPLPVVTLSSAPGSQIKPGTSITLFATSNPAGATYSWTLNGNPVAGATASTLQVNIVGIGKYKATVTDINGCTSTTDELTLTPLPGTELFIYPNPTPDGIFHVRFYDYWLDERIISVFNSSGALVAQKAFPMNTPYQECTMDLSHVAAGIYTVEVKHRHLNLKAVGKLIIR